MGRPGPSGDRGRAVIGRREVAPATARRVGWGRRLHDVATARASAAGAARGEGWPRRQVSLPPDPFDLPAQGSGFPDVVTSRRPGAGLGGARPVLVGRRASEPCSTPSGSEPSAPSRRWEDGPALDAAGGAPAATQQTKPTRSEEPGQGREPGRGREPTRATVSAPPAPVHHDRPPSAQVAVTHQHDTDQRPRGPEPDALPPTHRPVWEDLDRVVELPGLDVHPSRSGRTHSLPGPESPSPSQRLVPAPGTPSAGRGRSSQPSRPATWSTQPTPPLWTAWPAPPQPTPAPARPGAPTEHGGAIDRAAGPGSVAATPADAPSSPGAAGPSAATADEQVAPVRGGEAAARQVGPRDLTPSAVERLTRDVERNLRRAAAAERERRGEAPWRP